MGQSSSLADLKRLLVAAARADVIGDEFDIGCARATSEGRFHVQIENHVTDDPIVSIYTSQGDIFRGSTSTLIAKSAKNLQPRKGRPPKINVESWETSLGVFKAEDDNEETWTKFSVILTELDDEGLYPLNSADSASDKEVDGAEDRSKPAVRTPSLGGSESRLRLESIVFSTFPAVGDYVEISPSGKTSLKGSAGKVVNIGDQSNPEKRRVQLLIGNKPVWVTLRLGDFRLIDGSQLRDDQATPKLSLDPVPTEQDKPSPAISDVKLDPGRPQTLKAKLMKMWSEKKVKKEVHKTPGETQATSPGPVETAPVKREKTVHSEDPAAQMQSKRAVTDKAVSKSSNSTKRKKKRGDVRSAHSLQSRRKEDEPSEKPASRSSDSDFPDDKGSSDSSIDDAYLEDDGSERVGRWRRTRGSPDRGRKGSRGPTSRDADEGSTSKEERTRPAPSKSKSEKKKPVRQKGWREIRGLFTDVVVQKNEESEGDAEDSENEESSAEEAPPVLSTSRLRKAKLSSTERGPRPRGRKRRTEDSTVSEDLSKSTSARSRSRRREEADVEPEASSKASAKSEKKSEAKRSAEVKRAARTHGKAAGKAVDALEAAVSAEGEGEVRKTATKQPGKGSKQSIRKQKNSEEDGISPPARVRSELKSSKRQDSSPGRVVKDGDVASADSEENAGEKSRVGTIEAGKGSPKAVKLGVKVPTLMKSADEEESEEQQSFIEILAGYDFKDISDSMSFVGDEVILDVTGLKVKLVDYISKCCLKIARPDAQIEVDHQLPLLGSDELSEFLASLTFVLDGSLSIAPEFSKRWCSREGLNSQVVGFALSIVDAALKAALELKAKLNEKKEVKDPALGEVTGDQVEVTSTGPFQNAINAFVVLVNYLEYEDKTIGDAEEAGPEDGKVVPVVRLAERPELLEMVSPTMTLMELPKLKALKGPSSKLRQWASEYILCLLGTRALSDVERKDVIHRIVKHENIFSSFVDELQKRIVRIDERAMGTDETVADVLYELLENKEFLIRLADPEENETREKLADAFTSSFEKIVSGRPAGIVNNEINLKVLDAVTLFFKYAFLRGHVVGNSHLRSKFMTAFAALLTRTDEIIADVTGKSKNPVKMDPFDGYEVEEIIEDELIDQDIAWFLSISFRIFGVLGNRIGGGSLLSHLIESQFRGRRGLERLYTFAWKLQRSVGTEKLGEKDRTLFTVAFTSVQEAMESAHFSSRRQNPAVDDPTDVPTRGYGFDALGVNSEGSDTEIPRKLGTSAKAEPIRLRSLLQYPKRRREFEVVDAELAEFYREEMEAAFIRLTGSGEKPAPFKRLSKNEYLPAARKLLQSQGEHIMQCNCVEVPGAMACNDNRCLNRASMFECDEQHCQAGESCSNQRFQKRQYVPVKVTKAEGTKGWGLKPLEDVAKGAFVMEYQGEVIDEDDYERRKKRYEGEKNFYFMNLTPDLYLDASRKGNLARFINHSCDPNCATQKWTVSGEPCVGIFAVKDIPKGGEITFDYNIESGARGETAAAVKCECGAPNCKIWLTGKEDTPEIRKAAEEQFLRRAKVVEDQLKWINNRIELRARGPVDEPSSLSEGEDMDVSDEKLSTGMVDTEETLENPGRSPSESPGKRDRRVAFPGMYNGTDDVLPSIRIKKRTVGNGQASPELKKVETKEQTPADSMKKEETPLEQPNKELPIVAPTTTGTEVKPKPSEFPATGTTSQGRKSAFVETSTAGESNRESNIVEKNTAESTPILAPAPPPVVESKDVAAHAAFGRVDASGKEESSLVSEGTKLPKDVMHNDGKTDFIDESDNRDAVSGTIKTISVSESKEGLRVPGSPKRIRSETSELKDSNLTSDRKRVWQRRDRSPGQRRESPPYKRREVSPYDRRELSPYERRDLSPYRRETSPYKRRELSPRERRHLSPRERRESPPYRSRSQHLSRDSRRRESYSSRDRRRRRSHSSSWSRSRSYSSSSRGSNRRMRTRPRSTSRSLSRSRSYSRSSSRSSGRRKSRHYRSRSRSAGRRRYRDSPRRGWKDSDDDHYRRYRSSPSPHRERSPYDRSRDYRRSSHRSPARSRSYRRDRYY